MALRYPPLAQRANPIEPILVARRFRLQVRCNDCGKEALAEVEMADEPHDPATEEDFYASGAVNRLEPNCERCGGGSVTILRCAYIRQPTDV